MKFEFWRKRDATLIGVIFGLLLSSLPFYFEGLKEGSCKIPDWCGLASTQTAFIDFLGLFGTFATVIGLVYAVIQTKKSREAVELLTETKPMINAQDILDEFEDRIKNTSFPPVNEVYLMANTIAIGATGNFANFEKFKVSLQAEISRLKSSFHASYVLIEFSNDSALCDQDVMDEDSLTRLRVFYDERLKFKKEEQLKDIIRATRELHSCVIRNGATYHGIQDANSAGPHFILINPEENNRQSRLGIIWNIKLDGEDHGGEAVVAGFRTTNEHVILAMKSIFDIYT